MNSNKNGSFKKLFGEIQTFAMMQTQPQISLDDYTAKSIVLRAVPEDFFRPYSQFLSQQPLNGKYNPNLRDPSGQGIKPGWIFPKTKEAQVRQAIQQILSGGVPAQEVTTYGSQSSLNQGQAQTLLTLGAQQPQSQQNSLQQILSAAQARNQAQARSQSQPVFENQSPIFSSAIPIGNLPGLDSLTSVSTPQVPPGYQQITYVVIKPEVGGTLQLSIAGQKVPVKVESAETNNGIVNQAIIQLPPDPQNPNGQRTMISLVGDQWLIKGYAQSHSISLQ